MRANAIAVVFAIAQAFGSIAPLFYGSLIDKNAPDPTRLFVGYIVGATVMMIDGAVALALGVDAEHRSLEDIAAPPSIVRVDEGMRPARVVKAMSALSRTRSRTSRTSSPRVNLHGR